MYRDLLQRFWWTRMKRDIARFVAECDVCRCIKAEHQRPAGTLQPLPIPEWKWDKVGMDFITGFPKTQKRNDAIFVVIDRLSKVAHFLPVRESIIASQLADMLRACVISFGKNWEKFLPFAEFAYNNSFQSGLNMAPF